MWKKTGRYIPCDYCKKPIYLTPFQEKQSEHHFCSSKCCGNFQKKPMEYQIIDDYAVFTVKFQNSEYTCYIDAEDVKFLEKSYFIGDNKGFLYLMNGNKEKLHRQVMNCPKGMLVDHINHNTLDNRKTNLRIVSHSENMQNIKIFRKNTQTGHRNVYIRKDRQLYYVKIAYNKKIYTKAYFPLTSEGLQQAIETARKMRLEIMPCATE